MKPCSQCPRKLDSPCVAIATSNRNYCDMVAKGNAAVISLIENAPIPEANEVGQPPSLFERARLLVAAARKFLSAGMPIVDQDELAARLEACDGCTERKTCPKCGCRIGLKAAMATETCPLGKWPVG